MLQRNILCYLLLALLFVRPAIAQSPSLPTSDPPILLEWSAVEPRVEYLADSIQRMEELPFNAVTTVFVDDHGTELIWNLWSNRKFDLSDFGSNVSALEKLAQRSSQHKIFARFNVPTQAFDWSNDEAWHQVLHNARLFAQLCHIGRFDGIVFDTEQYGEQIFAKPEDAAQVSIVEQRLTQCGQEWMEAIHTFMPQPIIMFTFGYNAAKPNVGDGRAEVDYYLLQFFLDGIMEAAADGTRLIDGWEYSYGFRDEAKFKGARETFDRLEDLGPYRYRTELGFGIWLDYAPKKNVWSYEEPNANYFTPSALAQSVEFGNKYGSNFVWIYSQQPNWWSGERLPSAYVAELKSLMKSSGDKK